MERLFDPPEDERADEPVDGPLAARMRPRTLAEFVGQEHLLGEGSGLRAALESGQPHSMILYGPPGTGKTTLARLAAEHADAAFEELSAVNAGRAEVGAGVAAGEEGRGGGGGWSGGGRSAVGGWARAAAGRRSSSSTRSTASTRRSRTRCSPRSR